MTVLKTLRAADEPVLLEVYQNTTNLVERNSLTWALAFAGSNATVAAFKHTLTDEFKGRQITVNEARMMYGTVEALGMMSSRNEAAFALLKEGTDPWFWQRFVGWKSHNGPDEYGMLTSRSITGVAMSGRKEIPEILEALSKQPLDNSPDPRNWKRTFNSEVVIAAFQHALIRDSGREVFLGWFFTPFDDSFQTDGGFAKWSATPEGKKWTEWREKFDQEKLAQRKAADRWP